MNTKPTKRNKQTKQKAQSQKIYEQIARHIKQKIEEGVLAPGDKLPPMTELAKQFGVSRAAVREAFSSLVGMGLIDLRHGEGTFVQKIDVQTMIIEPMNAALLLGRSNLRELLEMRRLLEISTVRFACERRTEEELAAMREALLRQERALHSSDEWVNYDLQFHIAIAEAAGNNVLRNLMNTLSEALRSILRTSHEEQKDPEVLLLEHRQIIAAIEQRDGETACARMSEHLLNSEQIVLSKKA